METYVKSDSPDYVLKYIRDTFKYKEPKKYFIREIVEKDPDTGKVLFEDEDDIYTESGLIYKRDVTDKRNKVVGRKGEWAGNYSRRITYWGISFTIDNIRYNTKVHKIICFLDTGKFPDFDVDHHDGNGSNNKLSNLKPYRDNKKNIKRRSSSDIMNGVSWYPRYNKYQVNISNKGVKLNALIKDKYKACEIAYKYYTYLEYSRHHVLDADSDVLDHFLKLGWITQQEHDGNIKENGQVYYPSYWEIYIKDKKGTIIEHEEFNFFEKALLFCRTPHYNMKYVGLEAPINRSWRLRLVTATENKSYTIFNIKDYYNSIKKIKAYMEKESIPIEPFNHASHSTRWFTPIKDIHFINATGYSITIIKRDQNKKLLWYKRFHGAKALKQGYKSILKDVEKDMVYKQPNS